MKIKRLLGSCLLFVLTSITLFAAIGCSKREIVSVSIRKNSFLTKYEVDTEYAESSAFLELNYSSGNIEEIPVTSDMIVGFDTSTTGTKYLHIEYKGFKTEEIQYVVYNPEGINFPVETTARLNYYTSEGSSGTDYSIFLDEGDMEEIKAVKFTIESKTLASLGINANCDNVSAITDNSDANYYTVKISETKINVLVYSDTNSSFESGSLIKLHIDGGSNCDIKITNIQISDGVKDYFLPRVIW